MATFTFSEIFNPSKTLEEYKNDLVNTLYSIDPSIDLAEGTPQMNIVSVVSVATSMIMELTMALYNDNNPYTASLPALINKYGVLYGVLYNQGSRTQQQIQIVVDRPCNIYAVSDEQHQAFEISDQDGNIYIPTADNSFSVAGTYNVMFESKEYAPISSKKNTITNILTTTLGVVSVNNVVGNTTLGSQIESIESYRKRILRASRFYNTKGTTPAIIDKLINSGCIDAFIAKNYTGTSSYGVPSGAIAIITQGGDKKTIAEILSQEINSAYMYGFPAQLVPGGSTGVSYTKTVELTNKLEAFRGITAGVVRFTIGNEIKTSNVMDFSNCETLERLKDILINDSGFTDIAITLENDRLIFENQKAGFPKERIEMVEYSGTTYTDLFGVDFFDGANQIVIEDGYMEIAHTISVVEDRWNSVVTFNDAISVPMSIRVNLSGSATQEQIDSLKTYLLKQINENKLLRINKPVTSMDYMPIVKQYIEDNNMGIYCVGIKFKRIDETTWEDSLVPHYIYEIFNVSIDDINIG